MFNLKCFFLTLTISLSIASAKADSVYMAIVSTSTKYDALVTIYDSKCTKPDGNVILASGKDFANGCWSMDGDMIKVEWFDGSQPNFYSKNLFRLITDTEIRKR